MGAIPLIIKSLVEMGFELHDFELHNAHVRELEKPPKTQRISELALCLSFFVRYNNFQLYLAQIPCWPK